jgi:DNA-binding HxlR family transcriptional regulator
MSDHGEVGELCQDYQHAIELLGRRWTGAILQIMLGGVQCFNDIAASIPGLTDRMLSERLKELEAEGMVTRTVVPSTPVRVEYRLTEKGASVGPIIQAIADWAHEWLAKEELRMTNQE